MKLLARREGPNFLKTAVLNEMIEMRTLVLSILPHYNSITAECGATRHRHVHHQQQHERSVKVGRLSFVAQ
jgi:hypothetical protein